MSKLTPINPWVAQSGLMEAVTKGAVLTTSVGFKFRLAPSVGWSPRMRQASMAVATKPEYAELLKRQAAAGYEKSKEDADLEDRMSIEQFARGSVMGWGNVVDRDGKPLAGSIENVMEVLSFFPQVYAECLTFASNMGNFKVVPKPSKVAAPVGVDAEGNSSATSDTSSGASTD